MCHYRLAAESSVCLSSPDTVVNVNAYLLKRIFKRDSQFKTISIRVSAWQIFTIYFPSLQLQQLIVVTASQQIRVFTVLFEFKRFDLPFRGIRMKDFQRHNFVNYRTNAPRVTIFSVFHSCLNLFCLKLIIEELIITQSTNFTRLLNLYRVLMIL